MIALQIIFWVMLALIAYCLIGYPLLTLLLAAIVRKKVDKKPYTPKVSLIIAAYNEEDAIAEKIEQTLALDYPADKLEVIVTSDASTDRTDEIVKTYAEKGVILFRATGRNGKTSALNETVKEAVTGDILIFSDATGAFNDQAIKEIVANFNDPKVGCVTGRVAYSYGKDTTSEGFKGYQKFAVAVRRAETNFGSQTSVSGAIHAIRRNLYRHANPAFSLDVIDAVHTVIQGYRVVYENQAVVLEESREKLSHEFQCRIRISVRGTSMIPYILTQLFKHKKFSYAFQMISHKILRWWLWCCLIVVFATNMILIKYSPVYTAIALIQLTGYTIGIIAMTAALTGKKIPFLSTLAFFMMANTAMAVGAVKALMGKKMAKWEPVR